VEEAPHDPQHWHKRAEQVRKIAEQRASEAGRKAMLRIADLYDEYARRGDASSWLDLFREAAR
jgi:hypothetical protein